MIHEQISVQLIQFILHRHGEDRNPKHRAGLPEPCEHSGQRGPPGSRGTRT